MTRRAVQTVTWLAAVLAATGLGLAAVNVVGDAARGRGPLGEAVTRTAGATATPDSATADIGRPVVRRAVGGDFGTFTVSCRGPWAAGDRASASVGWQVVRFEPGPDDDVEAVFSSTAELVEVEVFCNRGRPTVAEVDRSRIGHGD